MTAEWSQYIIFIVIILLLVWSFMRRRRTASPKLDAVVGIISDVSQNLRILEERLTDWKSPKKFKTGAWRFYQDKVTFLDTELLAVLREAFTLAEDFNARIDSARKNHILSTLQDMPVERLRGPLMRSKEGLTAWLRANMETEMQGSKRRGLFGF